MEIHAKFNPYTAVQRHPSQWFVWVPSAQPLQDCSCDEGNGCAEHNTTMLTVSHDAVNLNSGLATGSAISLQERYVVPEVIPFGSASDVDTRSAGNPYAHHPNYTTPSQYFGHMDSKEKKGNNAEDVLTIMDIQKLADPFAEEKAPMVAINPPNDVTINKTVFSDESLEDLRNLNVQFPMNSFGGAPHGARHKHTVNQTETLNKKMLSPESLYELEQTLDCFEIDGGSINSLVLREFSPQTLADLREIRNFSQYTDFPGSSKDVNTCVGMSPTRTERLQFEWTENVAYGGI